MPPAATPRPAHDHDVVTRLRKAFRPEAAEGVQLMVQIVLTSESDEPAGLVWVDVRDGRLEAGPGRGAHPDVTFELTASDFCGVLDGRVNPDLLFLEDRLSVDGELTRALALRKLFRVPT